MVIKTGMVCRTLLVATSLSSTLRTPVPPLPKPGPSYLKSNTMMCLPRPERVLAFPAKAFEVDEVIDEHRLALEQVQTIATEASSFRDDHPFAAVLRARTANGVAGIARNVHLGGDCKGPVQNTGGIA